MIRAILPACLLLAALALAPVAEAAAPRVSFAARVLTVTAGKKDNEISIYCAADGNVRVNKRSPAGGKVGCGHIAEIALQKNGALHGSLAFKQASPGLELNDMGFQGRTDYPAEKLYDNLWVIRLAPDGRASRFTEWYMARDR